MEHKRTVLVNIGEKQHNEWLEINVNEFIIGNKDNEITLFRILPTLYDGNLDQLIVRSLPFYFHLEIKDDMDKDIIDHDRYQGPSFRDSKAYTPAKCSDGIKDVIFVSPTVVSLKPHTGPNIVIDYSEFAIKPNKDGLYHLTYSSFYEDTKTHFPPQVEIILKNEQKCSIDWMGFTKIYLFDYEFKLNQD